MTRLQKCELLKSKGYTYNPETGKIFGVYGKEITGKNGDGYIQISSVKLYGHHFAWYMSNMDMDFIELDHKNRIRYDNRIDNLRISNRTQQSENRNANGFGWCKRTKKWRSYIYYNKKYIHLGYYINKDDARNAYLKAKDIYHIIE